MTSHTWRIRCRFLASKIRISPKRFEISILFSHALSSWDYLTTGGLLPWHRRSFCRISFSLVSVGIIKIIKIKKGYMGVYMSEANRVKEEEGT